MYPVFTMNHKATWLRHLCKGFTQFYACTSKSIRRAPVSIHHATCVPGSSPGHSPAVVKGLARLSKPCAWRGLFMASCWGHDLVLGLEPTDNWAAANKTEEFISLWFTGHWSVMKFCVKIKNNFVQAEKASVFLPQSMQIDSYFNCTVTKGIFCLAGRQNYEVSWNPNTYISTLCKQSSLYLIKYILLGVRGSIQNIKCTQPSNLC